MEYDVITVGGATEDICFYTNEGVLIDNKKDIKRPTLLAFEYGAKIKIEKVQYTFGGGAANAAVCLSRLGFRVSCLAAIGNDERGRHIISNLHHHGVHTGQIERIGKGESGFSFILIGPGNEHIAFLNRGANTHLHITREERKGLRSAKWVYISSLSGKWQQVLDQIYNIPQKLILWNPGIIQLNAGKRALEKYLKKTTILMLNRDEAIELVMSDPTCAKKPVRFLKDINNLLKLIQPWGPLAVVITDGKEGAYAYDGIKIVHQKSKIVEKPVDTTGVGDAFGATFLAGLELYDANVHRAMHLASLNAASVVALQGAQNGLMCEKDVRKIR